MHICRVKIAPRSQNWLKKRKCQTVSQGDRKQLECLIGLELFRELVPIHAIGELGTEKGTNNNLPKCKIRFGIYWSRMDGHWRFPQGKVVRGGPRAACSGVSPWTIQQMA